MLTLLEQLRRHDNENWLYKVIILAEESQPIRSSEPPQVRRREPPISEMDASR